MNMNKYGTILTLSGLESRRLLDTFADFEIPHIQVSFYYLRKVFANPQEFEEYASHFQTVFIDHGLIYHKYKTDNEKQHFLEEYLDYVGKLKPSTYAAVVGAGDVDLTKAVDSAKIIYPLDEMKDVFEGDLNAMLSQLEWVGVGNKMANNEEEMGYVASLGKKHGTKLHAFGTSSIRVLKKWPFYSANSSSWRTGSRFANTYIYEGESRGLRIYQPTDKSDLSKTDREKRVIRTRLRNMVNTRQPQLSSKVDWTALLEDDSWEVDKGNLTQWVLYQRDLELDWRNKYHLEEDDIQVLKLRRQELHASKHPEGARPPRPESSAPRGNDVESSPDVAETEVVEEGGLESDPDRSYEVTSLGSPREAAGLGGMDIIESTASTERLNDVDVRMLTLRKCEFCILADRCVKFDPTPGAECAFGITESYDLDKVDQHIDEDMADILAMQKDRVLQLYLEEKADASGANKDLTNNLRLYMEMVALRAQAKDNRDTLEIKARGTGLGQLFKK